LQWVNPAFTALTGYTPEEAIGKNPRQLVKSGKHDRMFYKTMWEPILAGQVWRGETINRRKDGSLYVEDQTITPVRNESGKITNFIAIKQDITERKQAEEQTRKKDERHRNVIESIFKFVPEGVLVLTESQNLLKHNKAFDDIVQKYAPLLGYTEQELAEKIVEQLRSKILSGDTTEICIPKKSE
jgi:PAS domain S-box-containing protein